MISKNGVFLWLLLAPLTLTDSSRAANVPGTRPAETHAFRQQESRAIHPQTGRPSPWSQVFPELADHLHNHIVRFPIALGMTGAVLALVGLRWPRYESAARLLILVAALSSLLACWTGRLQKSIFEGSELNGVLNWHESLGATTTVFLWLGLVVTWTPSARRWIGAWALLTLLALVITGLWGSVLAHGGD